MSFSPSLFFLPLPRSACQIVGIRRKKKGLGRILFFLLSPPFSSSAGPQLTVRVVALVVTLSGSKEKATLIGIPFLFPPFLPLFSLIYLPPPDPGARLGCTPASPSVVREERRSLRFLSLPLSPLPLPKARSRGSGGGHYSITGPHEGRNFFSPFLFFPLHFACYEENAVTACGPERLRGRQAGSPLFPLLPPPPSSYSFSVRRMRNRDRMIEEREREEDFLSSFSSLFPPREQTPKR